MGRKHELTIRIPEVASVAEAVTRIREAQEYEYHSVTVDIADDGSFTARAEYPITGAKVTGRVYDDGDGPVLTAEIRKERVKIFVPFLMGFPAFFLPFCTLAQLLFDGIWQPFTFIGLPGGAALGYLCWKLIHQQQEHYLADVASYDREIRTIAGYPDEDD
ncbi:MAG TPA: hypothetical protein VN408_41875 [Actinoplanes sp.]|nr:hypothetical protein [Actinoplanes sp.]